MPNLFAGTMSRLRLSPTNSAAFGQTPISWSATRNGRSDGLMAPTSAEKMAAARTDATPLATSSAFQWDDGAQTLLTTPTVVRCATERIERAAQAGTLPTSCFAIVIAIALC